MPFSFGFHSDSGLTAPLTQGLSRQLFDGATPPSANDTLLYYGSAETGRKGRATSDPGVDIITVTPVYVFDAWASGVTVSVGDITRPTAYNGKKYKAQNAGTTGGSEPTWTTAIDDVITDNGINWECFDELHEPDEFILGLTVGDLDTNVPGAAISLGVQLLTEVANAVPVYVRVDQDAHLEGNSFDIKLQVTELDEESV